MNSKSKWHYTQKRRDTDYKSLIGKQVIITAIRKDKNESTIITVKRKDGKKFLRIRSTLSVALQKGIDSKEIIF